MSTVLHRSLRRLPPDAQGRTHIQLANASPPPLSPGDALIAPKVVGVCGTDWQILRGLRGDTTPVLGHEGVAHVVEPGDTGLPVGALVTVNPTQPNDPTFLLGHNVPGMWAERTRIPAAAVHSGLVLPVPDGADHPGVAALIEPLASVLYGLRTALRTTHPNSLVVWGDGIVGQLAHEMWRSELAQLRTVMVGHGAHATHPHNVDLPRILANLPSPVAVVIATPRVGSEEALRTVERYVRGTLLVDVHAGLPAGLVPLSVGAINVAAIRAENVGGQPWPPQVHHFSRSAGPLIIYGHRGVSETHMRQAVDRLLSQPGLFDESVLSHQVDLESAPDFINSVLHSSSRAAGGRRILKTAIRIGDHA